MFDDYEERESPRPRLTFKEAMDLCEAQAIELEEIIMSVLKDADELDDQMMNIIMRRASHMKSLWCIDYDPPTPADIAAMKAYHAKEQARWLGDGS